MQDGTKMDYFLHKRNYEYWLEKAVPTFSDKIHDLIAYIVEANTTCKKHSKKKELNIEYHLMHTESSDKSKPQELHVDAPDKKCYYTIIIPLTNDNQDVEKEKYTGTHFCQNFNTYTASTKEEYTDRCVNLYRGAVIFKGDVEHYGLPNLTGKKRIFLFIVVYTGKDPNEY